MDYMDRFFDEISKEKNDIYFYGAGVVAKHLRTLFKQRKIDFKGYMVDKKYLPEKASERFVDGKPMICPEELQNPAAVIPAVYLDVNGKGAYSLQHDMIKKVYKRDFSSYIQFGAYSDEFMSKHKEKLFDLFTRLVDDRSRAAMLSFIAQKYDGNYEKTYSDKIQYYLQDKRRK